MAQQDNTNKGTVNTMAQLGHSRIESWHSLRHSSIYYIAQDMAQ